MAITRQIRRERVTWRPELVEDTGALGASQIVYYVLGIVETILLFRFFFKLFAANSANSVVDFVYSLTAPLVAPFQGIFATAQEGGAVFETATLLAMIVYAVLASIIARLFFVAGGEPVRRVDEDI